MKVVVKEAGKGQFLLNGPDFTESCFRDYHISLEPTNLNTSLIIILSFDI